MIRELILLGLSGMLLSGLASDGKIKAGEELALQHPTATGFQYDFEVWEWAQLPPSLAKELKGLKASGKDINIDVRGPTYHRWTDHGVTGHLIEGEEAFRGKSVMVNNDTAVDNPKTFVIGFFRAFNDFLEPGVEYYYEVALKGNGCFVFNASISGIDPASGRAKWLGFPDLIKIELTPEWKVHEGTFKMPEYNDPIYMPNPKNCCGINVPPGTKVYFDDFKVVSKQGRTK